MQMDDQKVNWKVNKKFKRETEPDSGRYEIDYGLMEMCLYKVKDWLIDPRDKLGVDVRVLAKYLVDEGEIPLHLTAYAVGEIHDPKVP